MLVMCPLPVKDGSRQRGRYCSCKPASRRASSRTASMTPRSIRPLNSSTSSSGQYRLGHLRVVPKRSRKTETAGAGLHPRQGAAGKRRGLALDGRRGTSEIRTLDPRKMAPICCSRRVVFYHHGMGEAAVRSDIFPLVDGGLIGGRLWSEVGQRRAILRNLFGVPPM